MPYRCLYAKDVDNLFLGGRLISASHVAFSALRVMRTLGMLGEVVGLAAEVCKRHGCLPRDVYQSHLSDLKEQMKAGVPIPTAFACNGVGIGESYHFKDLGWFHLHTATRRDRLPGHKGTEREDLEKFHYCVQKLGIEHKYPMPTKWEKE